MITINNLSYYIGDRVLFDSASLHIKPRDKIGLIGLNGTGKTTLLKIINGEYKADEGDIVRNKECTIGYLNQDLLSVQKDISILSVAMEAFEEQIKLQEKINHLLHKLEHDYSEKAALELSHLQEEFNLMDGYTIQAQAEEILEGIGFSTEDLERPLNEFSGGWRMRVMLAKLLLEKPSLLMLDEPTNHLDLPSIQWVENYLKSYEGSVIVVSHDREFLNNVINRTIEVTSQQLISYEGNYTFYEEEKSQRMEIQKNAYENQQQKIKQTERFINRFRAKATKATQVQSRIKALERMDKVDAVDDSNAQVNFQFKHTQRSGRSVVTLNLENKAYEDLVLFKNTTATIERGDKIALIGANGKGKSTLLRMISGRESFEGNREFGHNVISSFYAQHQLEALNLDHEILEEVKSSGLNRTEQELRSLLGNFLFSDDDVFKKIKVLSGGEKSRVALAKVLLTEANFLILDEPTNHLDMYSVNVLIQALNQFQGTLIFVSHDRNFIKKVGNKVWWIEDQEVKEHPGNFETYLYWESQRISKTETKEYTKPPVKPADTTKEKEHHHQRLQQKELQKEIRKNEKELENKESEILELEGKVKAQENELAKPEVIADVEKVQKINKEYEKIKLRLERINYEWEILVEKLEELKADQ